MILSWLLGVALAAPITVDEVVRAALAHDPLLSAAEAEVTAAEGERRAATGLRHDPTLEARLGFGLPQHEVSLTQRVSLSGEGIAAVRAADAGLRAAEAERDQVRLVVAAEARRRLIAAVSADAQLERTREVLRLVADLREAGEARLVSGEVAELEVHLARLEEAAAAADVATARRVALAAREDLAAVTGLTFDVELPGDPMTAAPPPGAVGVRGDAVRAAAEVERADAALRRERAAALPPVAIGVWAQVQNIATSPSPSGVDVAPWSWSENAAWTVGPTLSLTLPVWNGNRAGVARAVGDQDIARSELAAVEARIAAEQAGSARRRESIEVVGEAADPSSEARAALAGVEAALSAGEIGQADATLLRARILDVWGRAAVARAEAAELTVDLALAEAWTTLLPSTP
jgi:cobalt-zinc-cadmium efflux system outer membrane protein